MSTLTPLQRFFRDDLPRTLFPLQTNWVLLQYGEQAIRDFTYSSVLNPSENSIHFLSQRSVYATKPRWHLRRTVKLDPVAEFFVYDLLWRNRGIFRKPWSAERMSFGYRICKGEPIKGATAHGEYRNYIGTASCDHGHHLTFDIASYFNHIYHHDVVSWFEEAGATSDDVSRFDQFLREINASRSVDCLPQGIYPTKMIGNGYLQFLDGAARLRSKRSCRFMDDIHFFDDSLDVLINDFLIAQELLGGKGLALNPGKTRFAERGEGYEDVQDSLDEIRVALLERHQESMTASGWDAEGAWDDDLELTGDEVLTAEEEEYLLELLRSDTLEEEDADLVLTLMRQHVENVLEHLPVLLRDFPNIARRVHSFCRHVDAKPEVLSTLLEHVRQSPILTEYQLFWYGVMLEDYLLDVRGAGELLEALYSSKASTPVTRAKLLEIPDKRFGLPELRESQLRTGQSDWLSWASAVGSRVLNKRTRNYHLKAFGNASAINGLIAGIVAQV